MALRKSGLILEMQNYAQYRKQALELEKLHKRAFDQSAVKGFDGAAKRYSSSSRQVQTASQKMAAEVAKMRAALLGAGEGVEGLGSSTTRASSFLERLKGSFGLASGGAGGLVSSLGGLITKLTAVGFLIKGAMDIVNFAKGAGDVAQAAETMAVSLNEVGRAVGYSDKLIELGVELLKEQGITTTVAQKSLLRMARANISWSEASKLAAIAQGSAVIAGMNSSEAFERLVTGIQKMEPELLDELGITLQREQAYKKFADSVGISSNALTQAQKQQAILNSIYEQSEVVIGVYDAAMETTGKQQASLARHIEETQLSIGKLILPFKAASVEMQTNFWKGLRAVAKGLESWAPLISVAIERLKAIGGTLLGLTPLFQILGKMTAGSGGVFETMARGAHDWARITLEASAMVSAGFGSLRVNFMKVVSQISKAWGALISGDFSALGEALSENIDLDFSGEFKKQFSELHATAQEKFPDVFKSWDEVNQAIEGTPEDLRLVTEATEAMAEDSSEAVEEMINVYQRLDDIHRKFGKDVAKLQEDTAKDIAKTNEELEKGTLKAEEKRAKDLAKLDATNAKERQKIIQDHSKNVIKEEKKRNRELEYEQKRFQLSQLQSERRFQIEDKKLRAEGDVLALMELRESHDLETKEAKENFSLQQDEAKKQGDEEQKAREEELNEKLADFDDKAAEERQRIQETYTQEIEELRNQNAAKLEEISKGFEERFNQLVEARNSEIEELGRSLQDEGKLTQDGMQAIAGHIGDVFGPDGASDSFIKGWTERTSSEFGSLITDLKGQLNELETATESAAQAAQAGRSEEGFEAGRTGGRGGRRGPGSRARFGAVGMRHGGSGVVTGPAHFYVEPGVKEHVAFTPLQTGSSGNLKHSGNINMGLDVKGLPSGLNDKLQDAIIQKSADLVLEEITISIERLKRRT